MIKKIIALLIVSAALVFFMPYAQQGMEYLLKAHGYINDLLTSVFNGGQTGNLVRSFIALLCIPLIVGLVPAIIFWMLRRRWMPGFMDIVWVVWLLQAGGLIAVFKATGA